MSKIEWHIEKRKIDEIKPHPKNPRLFTEKGMKDLDKSISKIGMAQPININIDGTILSGHARLMTLQKKGVQEVDVYVPSRELTEKEQEEVLIRMNANTAGEWDFEKLANEWESLELVDYGFELPEQEESVFEAGEVENEIENLDEHKIKIVFTYKDSRQIIDAFIKEMQEKYPQLLEMVQIND